MDAKPDCNKALKPSRSPWRIDFKRITATDEVEQWAKERGADRVSVGCPPLFIVGDVDKDEAMVEFQALQPVATKMAANDD